MDGLTQKRIEQNKEKIIQLLRSTGRDGIEKLISYLQKHDYFTAPASTKYHLSCVGGLAQHSLNVYYNMMQLYYGDGWRELKEFKTRDQDVDHDSIIIVALLHDMCKVDFYSLYSHNVKEGGAWKEVQDYKVDERIPIMGHGSKSVIVIQQFIRLYLPEIQAISFHMGMQDGDNAFSSTVSDVFGTIQLALYVHLADIKATFEDDIKCLSENDAVSGFDDDDGDIPF